MRVDVFHDNKRRENCFGLGVALCGSPRWSTSVHESEAAVIFVAKSVCDLWPTRSEEGCCVFCSTLRNCGHSSAARASGQQKPADDGGATLYMFNIWCVGSVSAFSKKMPGNLTTSKVESDWSAQRGAGSKVWSCRLGRRSGVAVKHRWEKCILVWLKQ